MRYTGRRKRGQGEREGEGESRNKREKRMEEGTGTLKKDRTLLRDERKMEKLKAKLHTDDDCECPGRECDVGTWAARPLSSPIICMVQNRGLYSFVLFHL